MNLLVLAAAGAQMYCAPADGMLEALKEKYHEVPVYGAATGPELEMPLVVTLSPEGSFTILLGAKGLLCVLSSGGGWTKLVE